MGRIEQEATEASTVGKDIARKASKKKVVGNAEEQEKKHEAKSTQKKAQDQDAAKTDESATWESNKAGTAGQNKHEAEHENEAGKHWNVDESHEVNKKESSHNDQKQKAGHSSDASKTQKKWNAAQHDISQDAGKQANEAETSSSHDDVHDAKKAKMDASAHEKKTSAKASKGESNTETTSHAKDPITWVEDEIREKIEEVKKVVEDAVPLDADMNASESKTRVEQEATEASTVAKDITRKASKK